MNHFASAPSSPPTTRAPTSLPLCGGCGSACPTWWWWTTAPGTIPPTALNEPVPTLSATLRTLRAGGSDIVLGSRMAHPEGMPWLRHWTNRTTSVILSRIARQDILDSQSGYKAIRTEVLRHVRPTREGFDGESEFLLVASRLGYRIAHVPIRTIYGNETSTISPAWDTWRFIKLCLTFILKLGPAARPPDRLPGGKKP